MFKNLVLIFLCILILVSIGFYSFSISQVWHQHSTCHHSLNVRPFLFFRFWRKIDKTIFPVLHLIMCDVKSQFISWRESQLAFSMLHAFLVFTFIDHARIKGRFSLAMSLIILPVTWIFLYLTVNFHRTLPRFGLLRTNLTLATKNLLMFVIHS